MVKVGPGRPPTGHTVSHTADADTISAVLEGQMPFLDDLVAVEGVNFPLPIGDKQIQPAVAVVVPPGDPHTAPGITGSGRLG